MTTPAAAPAPTTAAGEAVTYQVAVLAGGLGGVLRNGELALVYATPAGAIAGAANAAKLHRLMGVEARDLLDGVACQRVLPTAQVVELTGHLYEL